MGYAEMLRAAKTHEGGYIRNSYPAGAVGSFPLLSELLPGLGRSGTKGQHVAKPGGVILKGGDAMTQ
jgi:hypothetical protein